MLARGTPALIFIPAVAMVNISVAILVLELIPADEFPAPVRPQLHGIVLSLYLLTALLGLAFLAFVFFFRDPRRRVGPGVVSPADGRVLEADPSARRVSIFMGVADVHVNRAPMAGFVASQVHRPGGFAIASRPESERNERLEWTLTTEAGPLRLTQVAGIFARRIVPYVREGDKVKKGQRIGLVRFGSRVVLVLPPGARIRVAVGDRVRAGETTVGEVSHGVGP